MKLHLWGWCGPKTRAARLALTLSYIWVFIGGIIAFAITDGGAKAAQATQRANCPDYLPYDACERVAARAYDEVAQGFWITAAVWIALPIALGFAAAAVIRWIRAGSRSSR